MDTVNSEDGELLPTPAVLRSPPTSGPGSSVEAWRVYAATVLDKDEYELMELSRAEIIDLLPEAEEPEEPSKPIISASRLHAALQINRGAGSTDVALIEEALVKERLLAQRYADGTFGRMATRAYRVWQRRLGFRGHDADGIPDYVSLKRLGDKHSFDVEH